jgi:hypothetical protein
VRAEPDYSSVEIEENPGCPLCRFMRASPCGGTWVTWEKCLAYHKERDEDFVGPCSHFTLELAECINREKDSFPTPLRRSLGLEGGEGEDDDLEDEDELGLGHKADAKDDKAEAVHPPGKP